MVIKCCCYKDCVSKYIIILDSDLLLKQNLNFNSLIREDGKIEWKYSRIEDNNHALEPVFIVWKKACEDSNLCPKKNHYMSNGVPFIFTRNSLVNASKKFIELHNCDYETYCYNRCHNKINIEEPVTNIFNQLSEIFTEYEYLGFYCHHFSNDYIFTIKPNCQLTEEEKINSPFIIMWSHGGITDEIKQKIFSILDIQ
jgi:hypothetical protein